MRVSELVAGATLTGPDVEVTSLAYDSRQVRPGSLFAAWTGARSDGHAHVADAVARGAVAVLCEREVDTGGATRAVVSDSRAALARAARAFFGDPAARLTLVGVTGTNGKTTTTHLIEAVLAAAGRPAGIIGTLGARHTGADGATRQVPSSLTTPQSVDLVELLASMADAGTQAVAMEVSSHALHQHRVDGVDYDVGVFTNLTHDHLDYHRTLDAYFDAKALLVRARLKAGGAAVLNLDDPRVATLARGGGYRVVGFSRAGAADAQVRAEAVRMSADGIEVDVTLEGGTEPDSCTITSPLVGAFNVENVLAAVSVGVALGLEPAVIARGIAALRAVPGRLERVSERGQPLVLVDYAHTPDALDKALAAVAEITGGALWCVFGCGGDRDPHKRGPMGAVAARRAQRLVVTSDNPRTEDPAAIADAVAAGAREAGVQDLVVELDRARAIELAVRAAGPADAVLIAGKGHEDYQIVGTERRPFDDREVARGVLARCTAEGTPAGGSDP